METIPPTDSYLLLFFQHILNRWTDDDIHYLIENIIDVLSSFDDEEWDNIELFFMFDITGCEFLEQFVHCQPGDLLQCFLPPSSFVLQ